MRSPSRPLAIALFCLGACLGISALCGSLLAEEPAGQPQAEPTAEQLEFFESKVRPILVERCYECHSAKLEEPKGGLKVDSRSALLAGGETGPAIVPGKPKESLLIDAINYGDVYQMPPKSRMPADEIAILTKWVEQGAPWPKEADPAAAGAVAKAFDLKQRKADHWCWQPIQNPPLPTVRDAGWAKQDLDRFILARLEAENLSPAPPADKRTLVRRAYFDLIGLPPTPDEMSAALADESPEWFAHVVDKLLESPHFGERWGRHWLDLVRYAESRGHEFDYNVPNAYQYRDYVIRALNADVPYDQFVTEHIAGDLMPQPRLHPTEKFNESILGTGFWFLGEWVHSPVDIRKDETDRFDNMVDVFSKTFLAVTVSCARCHDHKFDAISQKDYYALFGFLQSSSYRLARFDTMQEHQQIAQQAAELEARHLKAIAAAQAGAKKAVVTRLADYLLAARELSQAGVTVAAAGNGPLSLEALDEQVRGKIVGVAETNKLDAAVLARWLAELAVAKGDKTHPFHAWAVVATLPAAEANDEKKIGDALTSLQPPPMSSEGDPNAQVVIDYNRLPPEQWMPDGVGFGLGPVQPGQLLLDPSRDDAQLTAATRGYARRDPLWKKLKLAPGSELFGANFKNLPRAGVTIRTPTFELKSGKVHVQLAGHGFIYAAVDSHSLIAGPLHGNLQRDTGPAPPEQIRWITLSLDDYKGHRLHLEITPEGEGDFRVFQVIDAANPPPDRPAHAPAPLAVAANEPVTIGTLAAAYQQNLENVVSKLGENALSSQENAADQAALAEFVLQKRALFEASDADSVASRAEAERLLQEYRTQWRALRDSIRPESRLAMAMWDGSGEDETLLIRGNPKTVGPIVPRRMLEALELGPMNLGYGSGRLELARSLIDERNPLTARVMVNRVWHHLFGRGIVPSTDNFGVLGQEPTHPELLDHLATRFRNDGWSLKRLIRMVMLSSTYQQDSLASAAVETRDPQNLLFHRQNMKRLEGEAIRDAILAVSGRLDRKLHGPSVPVFLTSFMQGRGRPGSGPLDGAGRRSIYISVRRNFLSPMMLAFDTPSPATTVGKRNVSNVPAQALILMNDPFVMEQARNWAKSLLAGGESNPEQRITRMYLQAFGREPTSDETSQALAFLTQQGAEYGLSAEQSQADERTWSDLCHVMYNVKEFVFVR